MVKTAHVLAADERNDVAEARFMPLDQPAAVLIFLFHHGLKYFRRPRVIAAQPGGVGRVNPGVLLFRLDGQRENFLLAQGR